jgi:predicted enzyme related to lactoylglutathione lyase
MVPLLVPMVRSLACPDAIGHRRVMDAPPFAQAVTFLYAEDPAACRRFYAEVLGLRMAIDQGRCAIYAVAGTEAFLGICEARAPREIRETRSEGGVVFTFVTPEVDAWHARLVAAGAAVLGPPKHSEEYQVYGFFFRDPAGYLMEVQRFASAAWPQPAAATGLAPIR